MAQESILAITQTNIDCYPQERLVTKKTRDLHITVGDLHASAPKMLHFLVLYGVLEITEKEYNELVQLYYTHDKNNQNLSDFSRIISEVAVNTKHVSLIRFIGDMLADRGKNDYYILVLLQKLCEAGVAIEILLSNHDAEFIKNYQNNTLSDPETTLHPHYHAPSLYGLAESLQEGFLKSPAVRTMVEKCYCPHLRLLSYSIEHLSKSQIRFNVFSHAVICKHTLQNLAECFSVESSIFESMEALAECIDDINAVFLEALLNKKNIADLVNTRYGYTSSLNSDDPDPMTALIWSRNAHADCDIESNFDIYFIHGHDPDFYQDDHQNLDNLLGKIPGDRRLSEGELLTREGSSDLELDEK